MASRRKRYRSRKINPTYYVFCEGKTEEAYVKSSNPGSTVYIFLEHLEAVKK